MRFRFGPIPTEEAFYSRKEQWNKCQEPSAWVVTWLISIPLSVLLALLFLVWVLWLTEISFTRMTIVGFIVVSLLVIFVHEIIHAFVHPDKGITNKTILGFWPSYMIFYAHYCGVRTKENFVVGLLAPFLILSVMPAVFSSMVGVEFWWLGLVIVLNASFSSIDLFGAIYIQLSVPKNSDVCNQGWSTYWCARRIKRVKDA